MANNVMKKLDAYNYRAAEWRAIYEWLCITRGEGDPDDRTLPPATITITAKEYTYITLRWKEIDYTKLVDQLDQLRQTIDHYWQ